VKLIIVTGKCKMRAFIRLADRAMWDVVHSISAPSPARTIVPTTVSGTGESTNQINPPLATITPEEIARRRVMDAKA